MSDFLAYLAGVAIFSAVIMGVIWAVTAVPDWAKLPVTLSPLAALPLLLWLARRRRVDGPGLLAEADRQRAEPQDASILRHSASPDRGFVASLVSGDDGSRTSTGVDLTVYDVTRNRVAFELPEPWSTNEVLWELNGRLCFRAQRVPGDAPDVDVRLEPDAKTAWLRGAGEEAHVPMREVRSWLESFYRRHRRLG